MRTRTLTTAVFTLATAGLLLGATAPTAAADDPAGSASLSKLVTELVTTGSGPGLLTGSNDAAVGTGSSDLAGALLCGLISISDADGITICTTGPVP
ncbi:hypothetical protein ACFO5K_14375 [Nocardia halotolerans]|uniref:Secreted protein n=1 Tax=Nocardia halotolerans TaxID=1755878 RepID=A0ABV8VIP6_9NOCA